MDNGELLAGWLLSTYQLLPREGRERILSVLFFFKKYYVV